EQLRQNTIPLWNPYTNCGMPFVANNQSACFYPETWLFMLMPPEHAFGWAALLSLQMGGWFMFLFLRALHLRRTAALVGVMPFLLCGFMVGWMLLPTVRAVPMWLPLMLLCVERIVGRRANGVLTPTPLPRSAALRSGEGNGNGVLPPAPSLKGGGTATATAPACEVVDWPDIPRRLVMVAIDQGAFQVVDVEYWKRVIRELAAVKINYIMPYFEGAGFFYEKYPFLALKGRNGFTIEKGKLLSEYAMQHGMRLVPQQQTLGHSGSVLSHPELKHLQESGDVYCSSNPETFTFLGDLFDELLQAFPCADAIHVGGDEFGHGFAKCDQCKARAEAVGKPGLYAEHMMKIHQMLADRKRGMMIWWHEQGYTDEAKDKLAKDIVVFDWHYGNQSSYPTLRRLQEEGFANTWATPAVTRYYNGGDDWNNTFGNISGFLAAGVARQVPGECTCTWVHGIWGGRNIFELNLYGVVFSGQCGWNSAASDAGDFRWRFARQWFGVPPAAAPDGLDAAVLQAMHEPYGQRKEQGFWSNNRVLEEMLAVPLAKTAEALAAKPDLAAEAQRLQGFCARADAAIAELRKLATRNTVTLDFMAHDVHIHDTLARRVLLTKQLVELWPQLGALPPAERPAKLQPVLDGLRRLAGDYTQIEKMFDRSILEAGGGRCVPGGWPADGGIVFRAQKGREEMQKTMAALEAAVQAEKLPEKAL
ncbi:family 20 glycosylhydrolase, partial [bacterium]|nr:family 20 glycosylhydrolase [bacterium]